MRSADDCKSKAQYRFGQRLMELFSGEVILEEFIIPQTSGMSLDFFMPRQRWAFEIQGRQHEVFIPYMHKTAGGFVQQMKRDSIKRQWCEMNRIKLIRINDIDVDNVDILGVMSD
jgi:hypothetical protein